METLLGDKPVRLKERRLANEEAGEKARQIVGANEKCNSLDAITVGIPDWDLEVYDRIAELV